MKNLFYICVILLLLLYPLQHRAGVPSDTYRNSSLAYLQHAFQRDSITKIVLDEYAVALRNNDNEALLNSYIRLSELSAERGDYQEARDYAYKAIAANNQLSEPRCMTHVYLNIYKTYNEEFPQDSASFSFLRKALTLATTDDDRFETYLYLASHFGGKRNEDRYNFWRSLYSGLSDERRQHAYADIYWRAESYHYIMKGDTDSAAIMRNRIPTPYIRYNALLSLNRRAGRLAAAMHYADSVDKLVRREAALAGTMTTAFLQAAVERSTLEHAGYLEQIRVSSAIAEIQQQKLQQEQMQLETERAAADARQMEMADEERHRRFQLEKARHQQQQLETEKRHVEHQSAILEKRQAGVRILIIGMIIVGAILFLLLLFLFIWTRIKARAANDMRRMNEEEDRLHGIAVEASASRDRFIRNMTAEMQQSLGEVSRYAQILADVSKDITEEERASYGQSVLNSSIRVVDHINSILNPNEYMPQADRASEEARIERVRQQFSQGMAVTAILLLFSSAVYSDHTQMYHSIYDTGYSMPQRRPTIDSAVLRWSDQAYRVRFDKQALMPRVEKGVAIAKSRQEKYGHCLLLSMPVICHYATGTWEEFDRSCAELRSVAKSNGYMQYYYYTYLKDVERSLRENNMFRAMTVLENMEQEANAEHSSYGQLYTFIARMKVSKKREDPFGVIKWAHLALDASRDIDQPIDISPIYIDMFHHTHGARRTAYGDSLLRMAVESARAIENIAHSNLERAYFCAVNNQPEDYYRHIAVYDSLNSIYNIRSSYELPIKAYSHVLKGDIDSALVMMNRMPDRFESYKYQLALASRHHLNEYALQIRDSLIRMRRENERQLRANDLYAISELNGTDSLRRIVAETHETALKLQAEQKAMQLRRQRMSIERERQNMVLKKLEADAAVRADEMLLHNAAIENNRLKQIAQTARAKIEAEKASHDHMMLLIAVGTLVIIAMIVLIVMIYLWRRRTAALYSKLQQKNQTLNDARVEAEHAIERKDRFIQNMSHELRTPLNAITGFAQLLALPADSFSSEERQRFAQHVEHNISLLSMLVDDIVDIGSVEKGSYKIVCADTNVNDILHQAFGTVEYRVPASVTMQMHSSLPEGYVAHIDGRRILQVLVNYLTNAIKHTVEGTITLSAELFTVDGCDMLRFAVADTGTGVPLEQHENVFARFVKLEKFVQGTGLGLSICRIIAEKMQGRCYLDTTYPASSPDTDHGARFVFELPVVVNDIV